jgi:tetratricopeptide (TPR) repeat protein
MKSLKLNTLPRIALGLLLCLPAGRVRAAAGTPTQELMDYGFKSFGNGDYEDAVNDFEQVLTREPDNVEAKLALEKAKEELGRQKKNNKKKEDSAVKNSFAQAEEAEKTGDVGATIDSLWSILESDPQNKKAKKSLDKIRAQYEDKLNNQSQGTSDWNFDQGLLAYLDKDWSRAFDYFQEARRLQPTNEAATDTGQRAQTRLLSMIRQEQMGFYRESAKAFYNQGLVKEALSSWQKVLEINPQDEEARLGIAQSEEAIARLENKTRSDEVITMIEEALTLYADRKWEESLHEWQKIESRYPTVESAKEYITKIEAKLASLAKERESETVENKNSWRSSKKQTAVAFVPPSLTSTEGNFPEAIKNMETILRRDPSNIKVAQDMEKAKSRQQELADKYYKDGLIAYSQGKVSEAIRQWQIVLRIDPEHAKARQAVIKAQAESGT